MSASLVGSEMCIRDRSDQCRGPFCRFAQPLRGALRLASSVDEHVWWGSIQLRGLLPRVARHTQPGVFSRTIVTCGRTSAAP
eukprot:7247277-Alexandrium_andersonii.AAC.1